MVSRPIEPFISENNSSDIVLFDSRAFIDFFVSLEAAWLQLGLHCDPELVMLQGRGVKGRQRYCFHS